jgi:hypothetical protein
MVKTTCRKKLGSISPYTMVKNRSRNGRGDVPQKIGQHFPLRSSLSIATVDGDWRELLAPARHLLNLLLTSASQPRSGQHDTTKPLDHHQPAASNLRPSSYLDDTKPTPKNQQQTCA